MKSNFAGFEQAPFGLCVTGLDERLTQVNAALCEMLGYSEQELLGRHWQELTHPDDLEISRLMNEQVRKNPDGCAEGQKRYIHRSGAVVWGHIKIALVRDHPGIPLCSVVHVEDVTERRRTVAALRESEERFRIMADGCPLLMWVTNAEGGIEFIHKAYCELLNITCEQMEGQRWHLALHPEDAPEDAPEYLGAFQRAVRDHRPFSCETRTRVVNDAWRWFASNGEPRFSAEGVFLGHVGISVDITDRKNDEQRRQFQHSLTHGILEASLDGVLVVDDGGVVISHNRRFLDVWRIGPTSIPGGQAVGSQDLVLLSMVLERPPCQHG